MQIFLNNRLKNAEQSIQTTRLHRIYFRMDEDLTQPFNVTETLAWVVNFIPKLREGH